MISIDKTLKIQYNYIVKKKKGRKMMDLGTIKVDATREEVNGNLENWVLDLIEANFDGDIDEIGEETFTFKIETNDGIIDVKKAEVSTYKGEYAGFFRLEVE